MPTVSTVLSISPEAALATQLRGKKNMAEVLVVKCCKAKIKGEGITSKNFWSAKEN